MTPPWLILYLISTLALGIFLWARARANKPPELGTVRYVPYTGLMFLAILILLLCFAYGAELLRAG